VSPGGYPDDILAAIVNPSVSEPYINTASDGENYLDVDRAVQVDQFIDDAGFGANTIYTIKADFSVPTDAPEGPENAWCKLALQDSGGNDLAVISGLWPETLGIVADTWTQLSASFNTSNSPIVNTYGMKIHIHGDRLNMDNVRIETAAIPAGDVDRDGQVDLADFAMIASQWLNSARHSDKLVVMVFDDGTNSQYQAAQMLENYGFGGTFFISEANFNFPDDPKMSWSQIKDLHDRGFEIGNHTYTHYDTTTLTKEVFTTEVMRLEHLCLANDIPRPENFAYPGFASNATVAGWLGELGYDFARTGGAWPYDPASDDPLEMPTCGAFGAFVVISGQTFPPPGDTMQYFINSVSQAQAGNVVVMTYHGIPGMGDPQTSMFKSHLDYLLADGYTCIPIRDIHLYR